MYKHRQLNEIQKQDLINYRKFAQLPLHEPPHFFDDINKSYILTASNFEHKHVMDTPERRKNLEDIFFKEISNIGQLYAWCILPNHYHLLVKVNLKVTSETISRIHRKTAFEWNKQDNALKRIVWFRFSDRKIRSSNHFWASVNYINTNPVKHYYVKNALEWKTSSIHDHIKEHGRDRLAQIWESYPVLDYGKGWDD
jgi:putative transposase